MNRSTVALLAAALGACAPTDTSQLSPELATRFEQEGVLRRADNAAFRWTIHAGTRRAEWEDRIASIVVTRQTVYLHKNEKIGFEITPRAPRASGPRGPFKVERDGERVRIRVGGGASEELWSFVPPDGDAPGWTTDIRSVMRLADSTTTRE
jgi:hypothetical protein